MSNLNYTSENLFDIKCLRENLLLQVKDCQIKKRILDGQIEILTDTIFALERHIEEIEKNNKKSEGDVNENEI